MQYRGLILAVVARIFSLILRRTLDHSRKAKLQFIDLAYLRLPAATLDSRMTEIVHEQFAQTDYRLKVQAKQFWDLLGSVQDVRRGVREVAANVLQPALLSNGIMMTWLTRLSDDHGLTAFALENQSLDTFINRLFLPELGQAAPRALHKCAPG